MAAKKPEKSKAKPVIKAKKPVKEKRVELKAKDKIKAKKSDKKMPVRAIAVEKAKSKVKAVLEKVSAKLVKAAPATGKGPVAKVAKGAPAAKALPVVKGGKKAEVAAPVEAPPKKLSKAAMAEAAKAEALAKKLAAAKNRCREVGCDHEGLLSGYCRLHYIKNWRRIKKKESILSTGQLDGYVEELVAKYPDKFLDAIENDLASEKEWTKVIADMELSATGDEDFVAEEDDPPITEATGRSRGFDDEDEDIY